MRGAFPFLFFLAFPLIGYLAYLGWKKEQQRREALLQWAVSNGFDYVPADDSWCHRWSGDPFNQGDNREARNVITGSHRDRQFTAFDYSYETHSTDSKGHTTTTTHRYAVTSLQLSTYLPVLQVTPEGLFSRLGNALGFDDVELESEEFNRRFRVRAAERKFACDVLTPRTMEALLRQPDVSWRIEGVDILAWEQESLTPATVVQMTAVLDTVLAGIPSFVWKDHT